MPRAAPPARGEGQPPAEERGDVYARVTEAIVAAIEAGAARGEDWRMPWHRRREAGASPALPVNVASRSAYRGVNTLALWAAAEARGYPVGQWGTYRQWAALGGQVRRGERAATVVFWRFPQAGDAGAPTEEEASGDEAGEGRHRAAPWAKAYSVFNLAQVDGYSPPADAFPRLDEAGRIAQAEAFFARLPGLDLRHGGTAAFYAPATDHVQLPAFADFREPAGYYGTLAHEATHWTGHPARLARDLTGRFGSEAYAAEELVAELGAAFVLAGLGLAAEPRLDHAQYVAHWLRLLRGDRRAIFTAASKAQAAADWMMAAAQPAADADAAA